MSVIKESHDEYLSNPAVSRSTLWDIHRFTPYKARYMPARSSQSFDLGTAAHIAILEPHRFDDAVMRGPEDRRGNKWKDARIEADSRGAVLLTSGDHDRAQMMRDAARAHPIVRLITDGAQVELSGYAEDEGQAVKVRPDVWSERLGLIADVKSVADPDPESFRRSVRDYGYHLQSYMYRHVWQMASGADVKGFFFICVSKDALPEIVCHELGERSIEIGRKIYEKSLKTYRRCIESGKWPSYPMTINKIELPDWDLRQGEMEDE